MTRPLALALALASAGALSGCCGGGKSGDGPLHHIVSGQRREQTDTVDPKPRVDKGSSRDLACELHYAGFAQRNDFEVHWWFDPADGGGRRREHHASLSTSQPSGVWFVYIDTAGGWPAGTYTCEFSSGRHQKGGVIVAD